MAPQGWAAKTAAENGLRVALVEMKTDPAKVQRACAQMFLVNMDHFYNERMYFSRAQQKWVLPANNFSVNYRGGYREFYACHFIAPNTEDRIEIGDYEANRTGRGTAAVVFDKGCLLRGLYEDARKAGVDFFLERTVTDAKKENGGVEVRTRSGDRLKGTFCIAADGINSLLARKLGLNRERTFLTTSSSVSYYITGVRFDRSEMICMGNAYDRGGLGTVHFCMLPSVYRDDEYWLYIKGQERFDYFTTRRPFKSWFHKTEVTHKRCAVISMWSPAQEPFKDNVVRASRFIPAVEYINANRIRFLLIQQMQDIMDNIDLYIAPSWEGDNLLLTNLTGHPCVILPNGFSEDGTPTSVTFVGRLFDEGRLIAFSKKY